MSLTPLFIILKVTHHPSAHTRTPPNSFLTGSLFNLPSILKLSTKHTESKIQKLLRIQTTDNIYATHGLETTPYIMCYGETILVIQCHGGVVKD